MQRNMISHSFFFVMLLSVVGHRSDHNLFMCALSHLLPIFHFTNLFDFSFLHFIIHSLCFFLCLFPFAIQSSKWWKMRRRQQQTRLHCKIEIAFASLTKAVFNATDVHDIIIKDSLNYHWITIDFSHLNSKNSVPSPLTFLVLLIE